MKTSIVAMVMLVWLQSVLVAVVVGAEKDNNFSPLLMRGSVRSLSGAINNTTNNNNTTFANATAFIDNMSTDETSSTPANNDTTSIITTAPTTECTDTLGWLDGDGDGCDWYVLNDQPGCPRHGSYDALNRGTANDNCCVCKEAIVVSDVR